MSTSSEYSLQSVLLGLADHHRQELVKHLCAAQGSITATLTALNCASDFAAVQQALDALDQRHTAAIAELQLMREALAAADGARAAAVSSPASAVLETAREVNRPAVAQVDLLADCQGSA